jgi:hypothetical protein
MKSNVKTEIEVTLVLTEKEARWLKGLVQNYLVLGDVDNEAGDNQKMRMAFWNELNRQGVAL